jgi:hypothetical protein
MKKIAFVVLCAGWFFSSNATDARVLTMGGNDNFFMDDISIFRNPANINYYPNMLLGSLGIYVPSSSDTGKYSALQRNNTDPIRPYGGTILSYSLNQSSESGNQYPLLSVGLVLNRWDPYLDYFDPGSDNFTSAFGSAATRYVLSPVGKLDIMLGYAMSNGAMIGAGTYLAFQKQSIMTPDGQSFSLESSIYKGDIGINWPIAKSMNLEASLGISSMKENAMVVDTLTLKANQTYDTTYKADPEIIANNNLSFKADLRLFSALTALNGDFVPHLSAEFINLNGYAAQDYSLGIGVNINIDKGFFWTGLEGLVEQKDFSKFNSTFSANAPQDSITTTGIGARLSAGLERNVVWDWLVLRIGVSKKLLYVSNGDGGNGHWEQNPESGSSNDDFASVGVGVNIENRFRIDGVVAKNVFYTFTNLISGPQQDLMNRITLTYSF